MCYDITFCSNKDCNQECKRNLKNINELEIKCRCGVSIAEFKECEYFKEE